MVAADFLVAFATFNAAASAAIVLVLMLRGSTRRAFGAAAAYRLWLVAPMAGAATLLPARTIFKVVAPPTARFVALPAPHNAWLDLDWPLLFTSAWAVGAAFCLALVWLRQCSALAWFASARGAGDVWRAEGNGVGPALVGLIRPRIIVPADFETRFTAQEQELVLMHERTHRGGGDIWVNAAAALAQCALWCNPFVHVAAKQMRVDQELACDSAVLARFPDQRRAYASALLKTQVSPDLPALACAWPPGSGRLLKERIAMLKQDAPGARRRFLGSAVTAALAALAGGGAWAAQPAQTIPVAPPAPEARPVPSAEAVPPVAPAPPAPGMVKRVIIIRDDEDAKSAKTLKRVELLSPPDAPLPPALAAEVRDGKARIMIRRVDDDGAGDVFSLELDGADLPDGADFAKMAETLRTMKPKDRAAWAKAHGAKRFDLSDLRLDAQQMGAEARRLAIDELQRQRDALDRAIARLRAQDAGAPLAPVPPLPRAPAPVPAPAPPR